MCDFQITYLLDNRFTAGIMHLRQPISLPHGFGERPSMSFFLYNQDGEQAIARPYLDNRVATGSPGASPVPDHSEMPKYHQHDNWDDDTDAPSNNFIYDFEVFRYFVRDDWHQALEHDAQGGIVSGSVDELMDAFSEGRQIKLAVRGLCGDFPSESKTPVLDHEVFIKASCGYFYTEKNQFYVGADPLVRVRPSIPLQFKSQGWDVTWIMACTDGTVVLRRLNPYTFEFSDQKTRYAMRWFVR